MSQRGDRRDGPAENPEQNEERNDDARPEGAPPSLSHLLSGYRSPLDAEEGQGAPDQTAPPGPEAKDDSGNDSAVEELLLAILEEMRRDREALAEELRALREEMASLREETLGQVAAHTAKVDARISDLFNRLDPDALWHEVGRLHAANVKEIRENVEAASKAIAEQASGAQSAYSKASSTSFQAAQAIRATAETQDQALRLKRRDWRAHAVTAVAAFIAGSLLVGALGNRLSGQTGHWGDTLEASGEPEALCRGMGFEIYEQRYGRPVCGKMLQKGDISIHGTFRNRRTG